MESENIIGFHFDVGAGLNGKSELHQRQTDVLEVRQLEHLLFEVFGVVAHLLYSGLEQPPPTHVPLAAATTQRYPYAGVAWPGPAVSTHQHREH